MLISFDENHLLTIQNPELPQLKTYHYMMSGYKFSSLDKEIFVYHKRNWKTINLKNLGEGMQVAYLQKNLFSIKDLDPKMIVASLALFEAFDEEKGIKYNFLPSFAKDIALIQKKCNERFSLNCVVEKKQWWTFISGLTQSFSLPENDQQLMTFLFMMLLVYGKFEEKNGELLSIKAHIPMIWIQSSLENWLSEGLEMLTRKWVFITHAVIRNPQKAIFQFSTNDPEVLRLFAHWWNLTKLDTESPLSLQAFDQKQTEIKNQLLSLISADGYQCSEQFLETVQSGTLKFLKY